MTDDVPAVDDGEVDDPVMRCEAVATDLDQLRTFLSEMGDDVDLGCRPVARRHEQGYAVQILVPRSRVDVARSSTSAAGVTLSVIENATEVARARQAEIPPGNRFEQRGETPRGLGIKE